MQCTLGVILLCDESQLSNQPELLNDLITAICGENLTSLFIAEEHFELIEQFRIVFRHTSSTPIDQIISHLHQKLRRHLHIVFSMSDWNPPTHNTQSSPSISLQQFELLLHRCSVQWFDKWPSDGLHAVAAIALQSW